MKKLFGFTLTLLLLSALFLTSVSATSTNGTIDPNNGGFFKAALLNDPGLGGDLTINFGKFTSTPTSNISITNNQISGFAWGASAGWIVMNCFNTTSGCSGTNSNFKVSVANDGVLSGYAWGENTGWINFGPFTNTAISQVRIDQLGTFTGTIGTAGYAWSQNMGYIVFDCTNSNTCSKTDYIPSVVYGAVTPPASTWARGGGGHPPIDNTTPITNTPTPTSIPVVPTSAPKPVIIPKSSVPTPKPILNPTIPIPSISITAPKISEIIYQPATTPNISVTTQPPSTLKMGESANRGNKVEEVSNTNSVLEKIKKVLVTVVPKSKDITENIVSRDISKSSVALPIGIIALFVGLASGFTGLISINPIAVGVYTGFSFKMSSLLGGMFINQKKKEKIIVYFVKNKKFITKVVIGILGLGFVSIVIWASFVQTFFGVGLTLGYVFGGYFSLRTLLGIHTIMDQYQEFIPNALIEVYSPVFGNQKIIQTTSSLYGTYHIEVPNGVYYIKISIQGGVSSGGDTLVQTTENFEVKNGLFNKEIVVKTK